MVDCFDAALAAYPILLLPVEDVVDPLCVTHAPGVVQLYRDAMSRGDRFPPVSVVRLGNRFFLADGHKRFTAYCSLRSTHILVEQWTTRRWLRDQWMQLARSTRRQGRLLPRVWFDAGARAEAGLLVRDTARHWRRIVRSVIEGM